MTKGARTLPDAVMVAEGTRDRRDVVEEDAVEVDADAEAEAAGVPGYQPETGTPKS